MRNIRRYCQMLLAAALIVCMLASTAVASEYDSVAQELKTLGLFQGTNSGFDLDRAPTRAEAAVMLVRMLGEENNAKAQFTAGTVTNPFTDVADWAKPYVSWLYAKNLTKGLSATTFGSTGQCSAKMYCTFVLRALDYSDTDGDFTFDQSEALAEYLGFYDAEMGENIFLRDYAVAISYRALAASLNGTDTSLLEKLIADGAVSATDASALLTKVKNYRDYCAAYDKYCYVPSISTMTIDSLKLKNTQTSISYTMNTNTTYKYITLDDGFQMEWISSFSDDGDTSTISTWIKDGYYYYQDDSEKIKIELTDSLMDSLFSGGTSTHMPALDEVKSISLQRTSSGTQYVLTYADDLEYMSILNDSQNLGFDTTKLMNYSASNCTLTVNAGSDGNIQSFNNSYDCKFLYDFDGYIAPLTISYTSEDRIIATGSSIYINFPDFSGFTEQG